LLLELLGDPERRAGLAAAMRLLAPRDAAARVCDAIAEG
jgi:UDP-N-acetylglucosamine:LPS N-acetylglucosamine transferase